MPKMLSDDDVSNAIQSLSDGLRGARAARGLTMDQLASLSGVNKSTLSRIENNLIAPSAENLLRLASALNVGIDGLFGRRAEHKPEGETDLASPDTGVSQPSFMPLEQRRAHEFQRLNFLTRPSLTVARVNVTRSTNVPSVPTRKRMEEHLVALSGSFDIQYDGGLVQSVGEGEVVGLISRQSAYKLKLTSSTPAVALRISVPMLRDRLKQTAAEKASSEGGDEKDEPSERK